MKINICIIENELAHTNNLIETLRQWEKQNQMELEITSFFSGSTILEDNMWNYHILFLDIELEDYSGIEIAQTLRANHYKGEIVFLTSYREYVFEGYNVHALNYFLKPVTYQQVDFCLQYIKNNFTDSDFIYRHHNNMIKIPYNDILYFSSSNQYTEIHTVTSTYKQAEALKNILKHLPQQFVRCHRTTIVNINHVEQLTGKSLLLSNNKILWISNTYLANTQKAFLSHISGTLT